MLEHFNMSHFVFEVYWIKAKALIPTITTLYLRHKLIYSKS
jgi:hypothetical protein